MASNRNNTVPLISLAVAFIVLFFGNNLLCRKEVTPNIDNSTDIKQEITIDNSTNIHKKATESSNKINRNTLILSMNRILDKIHEEISMPKNKNNQLSSFLIREIIELSYSLEPYKYSNGLYLSKERGSLIKHLSLTRLNKKALNNIYKKGNFKYSDLIGANLDGAYLNGLDLSYSNFYGATFKANAQIEKATFIDCVLDSVSFEDASLNSSIIKSTIHKCIFDGTILTSVDFNSSFIDTCTFYNSFLKKADLSKVKIRRSVFKSSDLGEAIALECRESSSPKSYDGRILASISCINSFNDLKSRKNQLYKFDIDSIYTDIGSPILSIKIVLIPKLTRFGTLNNKRKDYSKMSFFVIKKPMPEHSGIDIQTLLKNAAQLQIKELETFARELNALINKKKQDKKYSEKSYLVS